MSNAQSSSTQKTRGLPERIYGFPVRESVVLLYAIIGLTFVYYHARLDSWGGLTPDQRLFVWMGMNFLFLFVVPALLIRFVLRQPLSEYGLRWGDARTWGRYFLVYFLVMVPIILIISREPSFHAYYPRVFAARTSSLWLLLSSFGWLVYFFAWEWFFRGFMLFGLAPRLGGAMAIMVQMVPFVMMHYGKIEAETWSSIICGIVLGLMAFRGRSFVGTWILHWLVQTMMNLSVVWWPLVPR